MTSLFPNISLNEILEIEFQYSYAMKIKPDFNNMEFFELIWFYERLSEQRQKENEEAKKQQNGGRSLTDMFGGGTGG